MSDETPKPLMPKRPYAKVQGEPAEPKPLSKKTGKRKTEDAEQESCLLTVEEKACVLISVEQSPEVAAMQLNMTVEEVKTILDSAPVRVFLQRLQDQEMVELAKVKVRRYRKVGISRTAIEERLFDLMNMDPEKTKGNIDGQVKAAAALADKFGYAGKVDPLAGKSPAELEEIVKQGHGIIAKGAHGVN
jgi:hypothetical protein